MGHESNIEVVVIICALVYIVRLGPRFSLPDAEFFRIHTHQ
jgi:hypothetical protein|eukprot:COSAG06_NODE_5852_length_3245_cov_1.985060_2_plen_41_part_00